MLPFPLLNPTLAMITPRCVPRTAAALAAALAFTPLLSPAEKRSQERERRDRCRQQTVETRKTPDPRAGRKNRGRKQDLQDLLQEEADAHAQLARELTRALEAQSHLTRIAEASSIRLRQALTLQKHIALSLIHI